MNGFKLNYLATNTVAYNKKGLILAKCLTTFNFAKHNNFNVALTRELK